MRYTYIYTSPTTLRHPIRWEATIEESANLLSLAGVIFGKDWNARDKRLFNNPYAQFLKFESDFTKTWSVGDASSLVGHVNTSVVWSYGNNMEAPYSEEYYVGGANSIRAFAVRDIGPGAFSDRGASGKQWKQWFYLMRNGDLKFVANLEYRMPLFGNMKGAVFLDAGNVWRLKKPDDYDSLDADYKEWLDDMFFKPSRFLNDIALGTGLGLRYDMGFLVVRVDWGIALHLPCNNGISKYFFNVERFRDLHTLHFAIGYPF
jgi:outer membrane protein assembly factor BamA